MALLFILVLLSFPFIGLWLGRGVGSSLDKFFGNNQKNNSPERNYNYTDNSVHHHQHIHEYGDKKVINENHLHQNLTVIDEETHKRGVEQFEKENSYD